MTQVWPGRPFPLGPRWTGEGTNFSLFSENAERVELCLFDDDDNETRAEADPERGTLTLHRGPVSVVADFADRTVAIRR